jgi:hypothetical protein
LRLHFIGAGRQTAHCHCNKDEAAHVRVFFQNIDFIPVAQGGIQNAAGLSATVFDRLPAKLKISFSSNKQIAMPGKLFWLF